MPLIHLEPLPRRASKGDVVTLLARDGGLDRRRVGRIELRGRQAIVEVPDGWESRLVKALDGRLFGDRRMRAWSTSTSTSAEQVSRGDEDHSERLGAYRTVWEEANT